MSWQKVKLSECETHHVYRNGEPLYSDRYSIVLPFHEPGVAPVLLGNEAWHINQEGEPVYNDRYQKTFGFYCNRAAVVDTDGWFHIDPVGRKTYPEFYDWVGNYQDNVCTVRDSEGKYFHINLSGGVLYRERWDYAGDFRGGIGVVQDSTGKSSHILKSGELLHQKWFLDLDVFHKGFSRARFCDGWTHINKAGEAVYPYRFANIEPFYNGYARVEKFDGSLVIIDESGSTTHVLRQRTSDAFNELSSDLVGFWSTLTIGSSVELGIIDLLPLQTSRIALQLNLDKDRTERFMWALAELNIVFYEEGVWRLTDKGNYLTKRHPQTLAGAALEYKGDLLTRWQKLPFIIKGQEVEQNIFTSVGLDLQRCKEHHAMLGSYAKQDYKGLISSLKIQKGQTVFDAGGGTGILSRMIKNECRESTVICGDLPNVLASIERFPEVVYHEFDLFSDWNIKADIIIFGRILHDWNDHQVISILLQARKCIGDDGKIVILEMVRKETDPFGALCDMHLLTVTGGQERTLSHYKELLDRVGLKVCSCETSDSIITILRTVPQRGEK